MRHKILRTAALCAVTAHTTLAGAQTRCDALPTSAPKFETQKKPGPQFEAQCNPLGLGLPGGPVSVASGTAIPAVLGGGTLQFVNGYHSQCEQFKNGAGTGKFKADTLCVAPNKKAQANGVWLCQGADVVTQVQVGTTNPRLDCLASMTLKPANHLNPWRLPLMNSAAALSNSTPKQRLVYAEGPDVAAATSVSAVFVQDQGNRTPRNLSATLVEGQIPVLEMPQSCGVNPGNCQPLNLQLADNVGSGVITVTLTPPAPAKAGSFTIKVQSGARSFSAIHPCSGAMQPSEVLEVSAERHPSGVAIELSAGLIKSPPTPLTRNGNNVVIALCAAPNSVATGKFEGRLTSLDGRSPIPFNWSTESGISARVNVPPGRWRFEPANAGTPELMPRGFVFGANWTE